MERLNNDITDEQWEEMKRRAFYTGAAKMNDQEIFAEFTDDEIIALRKRSANLRVDIRTMRERIERAESDLACVEERIAAWVKAVRAEDRE